MRNKVKFLALAALCWACGDSPGNDVPWTKLFNGTDLEGWTQKGGVADYQGREGSIVGTTIHDTPHCFLVTDRMDDDSILELEYLGGPARNSAVQLRRNSCP